jgi:O-antigen ligase
VFCGIALACADGIPNRRRLDDILRVLVGGAGIMAFIGIVQAVLDFDITRFIQLPGFQYHYDLVGLEARSGFNRVASTTGHYIELSAVMAATLPFAIHLARFGETPLVRQLATISGLLIAAVIPLTLSRTGLLAMMVMVVTMLPAWPWRTRFNVLAAGVILMAFAVMARPGLLGTIFSLFGGLSSDPSIQGRTNDYDIVYEFFTERPWLGRGPGTLVPELYLILDNAWLGELVQGGILGVAALAGVHLTAITLCVLAIRRATSAGDRHLAVCLLTVQIVAVIGAGTFDSFAFSTFATTLAIGIGLTGALWRLTHPSRQIRTTGARLGPG